MKFIFNDYSVRFLIVIAIIITSLTRVISGAILIRVNVINAFLFRFNIGQCKDEAFMFSRCKICAFAHFMSGFLICGVVKFIAILLVSNNPVEKGLVIAVFLVY